MSALAALTAILFITASKGLYAIPMRVKGANPAK